LDAPIGSTRHGDDLALTGPVATRATWVSARVVGVVQHGLQPSSERGGVPD